jgi:probable rRNA maturation factor
VPTALKQAREQGHPLAVEIKVLILHGLLHLAGFDHEADTGEMARRERVLRGRLGLPSGLIERSAHPNLATRKNGKDGAREVRMKRRASRNAAPSTSVAAATFAQDDRRKKQSTPGLRHSKRGARS